jgi:hypothetical protein
MTTRAASRAATNSTAPSVASAGSRRSSINDASSHVGGFDIDAERPAKRSRLSDQSNTSTNGNARSGINPANPKGTTTKPKNTDYLDEALKRLPRNSGRAANRSTDPSEDGFHPTPPNQDGSEGRGHAEAPVEFMRPKRRAGRGGRGGRGGRWKALHQRPLLGPDNGNDSPVPETSAQDSFIENGVENNADLEPTTKATKRMPGRRRAPNPNVSIEADLRRQLSLKTSYRAVAKALKPVLAELAQRSIDEIEEDEEAHKASEQYEIVRDQLDARLAKRTNLINNETAVQFAHDTKWKEINELYLQRQFEDRVFAIQDEFLIKAKEQLLTLARQNDQEDDSDATEDEHGLIPPKFGARNSSNPVGPLDERYESRSRRLGLTERMWAARENRIKVAATLAQHFSNQAPDATADTRPNPIRFGSADPSQRDRAIGGLNLLSMLNAAEALREEDTRGSIEPQPEIVPSAAAEGLLALAMASEAAPKIPLRGGDLEQDLSFEAHFHQPTRSGQGDLLTEMPVAGEHEKVIDRVSAPTVEAPAPPAATLEPEPPVPNTGCEQGVPYGETATPSVDHEEHSHDQPPAVEEENQTTDKDSEASVSKPQVFQDEDQPMVDALVTDEVPVSPQGRHQEENQPMPFSGADDPHVQPASPKSRDKEIQEQDIVVTNDVDTQRISKSRESSVSPTPAPNSPDSVLDGVEAVESPQPLSEPPELVSASLADIFWSCTS